LNFELELDTNGNREKERGAKETSDDGNREKKMKG
jgi:hypothetical protein